MTGERQLVWMKKGFNYVLPVADGYKFVRGWRKRWLMAGECGSESINPRQRLAADLDRGVGAYTRNIQPKAGDRPTGSPRSGGHSPRGKGPGVWGLAPKG